MRPFVSCIVVATILCQCKKDESDASTSPSHEFKSAWESEEHWMTSFIARDLASMAGKDADQVIVKSSKIPHAYSNNGVSLKGAPSCWDTATYKPLLDDWAITASPSYPSGPDLLPALLTPTVAEIQKANEMVSSELAADLKNPAAHERAAFLLGVFGLRENAWHFADIRPLICQMTAHLAFAGQLRGSQLPSPEGAWAKVLHSVHMGRPKEALADMENISSDGPGEQWKRVVDLIVTGDWRLAENIADPSLMETIAHVRAAKTHLGNPAMLEIVKRSAALQDLPEWTRTVIHGRNSVEEGHMVREAGMGLEIQELSQIFPVGENAKPSSIGKSISLPFDDSLLVNGKPEVISRAKWAAYFRRHFIATASAVQHFNVVSWASPEAANEWEKGLLPFVKPMPEASIALPFLSADTDGLQKKVDAACDWIRAHPERVNVGAWFDLQFPVDLGEKFTIPDQRPWFRQTSPPSTAHDPEVRTRYTGMHTDWLAGIKALHAIDPWDRLLCTELGENTGNTPEATRTAWGPVFDYSVVPIRWILKSSSLPLAERIVYLKNFAAIDSEEFLDLGEALVLARRPEEAIKAYEKGFEKAADRVAVANKTQWMIHYYVQKGDLAAARKIVDHNTEIFSASGLFSGVTFGIVTEDLLLAKKFADDIEERYGDPGARLTVALATGDKETEMLVFPDGRETTTLGELESSNARSGQRIKDSSTVTIANGVRPGDIILAIEGTRVKTYSQYISIIGSGLDPEVSLIIRRGKKFLEIPAILPGRRLECDLDTVP